MKVVVASTNPVKTEAAHEAFLALFPDEKIELEGISVPSGINEQPMTDEETILGAVNRITEAQRERPEADYWVGIEGGCQLIGGEMAAFAWAVVKSGDKIGRGRTGEFFLPPKLKELIGGGKSLGEADDVVFGRADSGQQNGSVGLLTHDLITRTQFHKDAVILALIPFVNKELYTEN